MLRLPMSAIAAGLALTALAQAGEVPAKKLFGHVKTAAHFMPESFGTYNRGCLAGAVQMPADGEAWQAMRLKRNRRWGQPALIAYVEKLAREAREAGEWPGLMVGDFSQPRGGPMLSGHRSHQIGLDADIWLRPMPDRPLSAAEREKISAISVKVGKREKVRVNPKVWTRKHFLLLRRAASYPEVARIFVNPAIKRALCDEAGKDRGWLRKIRPWFGHHYHFHVRLKCPKDNRGCKNQPPPAPGDGCGKDLAKWFKPAFYKRKKPKGPPPKPRPPMTLADMPPACKVVINAR